jgi:succinate dehydrogenase / fumarate reductase flavoprotein subunit
MRGQTGQQLLLELFFLNRQINRGKVQPFDRRGDGKILVVDGKSPMSIARNLVLVRSNVMLTPL